MWTQTCLPFSLQSLSSFPTAVAIKAKGTGLPSSGGLHAMLTLSGRSLEAPDWAPPKHGSKRHTGDWRSSGRYY